MEYKLDMSGMLATHDALRRDLVQVARIAGGRNGNPATRLHAVLGWELFKKFLMIHHQAEDDVLWPPLCTAVAGHPDQLALVDALVGAQVRRPEPLGHSWRANRRAVRAEEIP